MQRKHKILIMAGVALLLLALAGLFSFKHVRASIRTRRNKQLFAARQVALRKAAATRFMAAIAKRKNVAAINDPDGKVLLKNENPGSLQDEKNLRGRTLWVDAGGQLDFYRYTGRSIDFSHSEGTLLGAQKILVKDAVQQVVPESAAYPIPRGDAQILLIFTFPDERNAGNKEFAVAVGDKEGGTYNLLTDQIMFYEDPHKLYSFWDPQIWKAIDEHRAIVGMTERQVLLALGQVRLPRGDIMGDRLVEYNNLGHPVLVTFGTDKKSPTPGIDRVTKIVDETQ